mgnify:CR=1 FL=1
MEIILLEKVRNLGNLGDLVKVRSGYGRNFLIPQGKAAIANEKNKAVINRRRDARRIDDRIIGGVIQSRRPRA